MKLTQYRKRSFCKLFEKCLDKITIVDVGSGGPLKKPWNLIPTELISIIGFEPTETNHEPLCISNHDDYADFFIAHDERSSSLHEVSSYFLERFGYPEMSLKKIIQTKCTTLDKYFKDSFDQIDALDINVEGHDFYVLQGGAALLTEGFVKLIKVEFEMSNVYKGQGWFSEIDDYLRTHEFELASIDIDYVRPLNVRSAYHQGEPLWGKALYVPSIKNWQGKIDYLIANEPNNLLEYLSKSILLYVTSDLPGRSLDLMKMNHNLDLNKLVSDNLEKSIIDVYKYARFERMVSMLKEGFARLQK